MRQERTETNRSPMAEILSSGLMGASILFVLVGVVMPDNIRGQSGSVGKDVNVVNTPNVNVSNPVTLAAGASVNVISSAANPVLVRSAQSTAVAFTASNVSFSGLEALGDIEVAGYEKIRIVVLNRSFAVDLVVNVVEAGQIVGVLDVIAVPGCDGSGGCVGTRSISRLYEVPGRKIRFTTNADQRATGDVVVFGR